VKALLYVVLAWGSGHTQVTSFPSMPGCEAAAKKIEAKARETYKRGVVLAICVEDR
jgi:hypothetical protein